MDPRRFEEMSRRFARAGTRRGAIAALAGGMVAGAFGLGEREADAGAPIVHCKAPGQKCQRDQNCCSRHCTGGICDCSQRGRKCWQPLEGGLCCSGRCRKGKCK